MALLTAEHCGLGAIVNEIDGYKWRVVVKDKKGKESRYLLYLWEIR